MFFYGAAGHDDSHITYSAVQQLNNTGYILNTNGAFVEQGSSLLHVLLLSTFSQIFEALPLLEQIKLPDIGFIFSLLFAIACLPVAQHIATHLSLQHPTLIHITLLTSLCFSYWATGGLETSLVAFTILCYVTSSFTWLNHLTHDVQKTCLTSKLSTFTQYVIYCISACALIAVRPENIAVSLCYILAVFTAITCAMHNFSQENTYKILIKYAILSTLPLLISFALISYWRLETFGLYFPQPVAAKASGLSLQHILFGLAYFPYSSQLSLILLSLNAVIAALLLLIKPKALTSHQLLLICCLSFCASYLAFIIFSGGDWMLGGRFFTHIAPLLLLIALCYIQQSQYTRKLTVSLIGLLSIESLIFSYTLSTGIPANKTEQTLAQFNRLNINTSHYAWSELHNSVHLLDILFVNALKPIIQNIQNQIKQSDKVTIASVQMGMTPYHLNQLYPSQLYFIDMRGLSSQELSQCNAFDTFARRQTGIYVRHDQYIKAAQQQNTCNLPLPDIVYDLASHSKALHKRSMGHLQELGYTVIWQQSGGISHGLQVGRVSATAYIAVSNKIYEQLQPELQQRQQVFSYVY